MRARLRYLADLVLNSYWFLPGLMAVGSILLSLASLAVDARVRVEEIRSAGPLAAWVYLGGVEGAREVLSTIAGSMITVAGVVFSITIVALTLASSQFGPRVLTNFMRDRGNQIVLGTFISTFLYCLLVLRTIGGEGERSVPHLSVTLGIVLALVSLAVLIFFIHHIATEIQAPVLVAGIAGELHRSIRRALEAGEAGPDGEPPDSLLERAPRAFDREAAVVRAHRNGYIEAVDLGELVREASERDLLIRLEYRAGHFVTRGTPLARVWPARGLDEELGARVRRAVVIGPRRTAIQDMEFMVNQLVEVAVRALSPSINDPFTALACIDRLGAALGHLMRGRLPATHRVDASGELRLVMHRPLRFEGIVDAGFHQIRQNAGHHVAVYVRMLGVLAAAARDAGRPEHLEPLLRHAALIREAARENVPGRADLDDVERAYRDVAGPGEREEVEIPEE